jgi:hypothetical protein
MTPSILDPADLSRDPSGRAAARSVADALDHLAVALPLVPRSWKMTLSIVRLMGATPSRRRTGRHEPLDLARLLPVFQGHPRKF